MQPQPLGVISKTRADALYAALGFRYAPPAVRRLALVIAVYVPPTLLFGVWGETRLQWVIWLIAIPYALFYLKCLSAKDTV